MDVSTILVMVVVCQVVNVVKDCIGAVSSGSRGILEQMSENAVDM